MDMKITQEDQSSVDLALKHLGFDTVEDMHYWATDNNELNRFDALVVLLDERAKASEQAVLAKLRNLPDDVASYIAEKHCFSYEVAKIVGKDLATALAQKP